MKKRIALFYERRPPTEAAGNIYSAKFSNSILKQEITPNLDRPSRFAQDRLKVLLKANSR